MAESHNYFIGIDLGTSGCRAIAIDESGQQQAEASIEIPPQDRNDTSLPQDPTDWWDAVIDVLHTLSLQIEFPQVKAISVDGTSATLVITDEHCTPLAPALMYNDTRAVSELKTIRKHAPADSVVQSAGSTLAKVLWSQKQGHLKKCRYIMHQCDWITAQLSGMPGFSDTNNCLKLGYDAINNCWPKWFRHFPIAYHLLPRVVKPGTAIGKISPATAKLTRLPESVQVFAGTTDSTAAVLATGIQNTGDAVTSLGSTLVLKILADKPLYSVEHGIYSHPFFNHWLVGGASNTGGAVLQKYFNQSHINTLTDSLDPDKATGLDYYPLLSAGERFPVNDHTLAPRLEPRPDDDVVFFQGMLEGIANIERQGYQLLTELGAPSPTRVVSIGGGAGNKPWRLIRERLLRVPVEVANYQQAAYGTALLAKHGFEQQFNPDGADKPHAPVHQKPAGTVTANTADTSAKQTGATTNTTEDIT